MSQRTTIEWATHTWNPVTGCTKVSQGCKHCYAERMAKRFSRRGILPGTDSEGNAVEWDTCESPNGPDFQVLLHPERLDEPLHWRKPRRVFVCSMSDLFHEAVSDGFIQKVLQTARACPQHTFMFLTKRPERMRLALLATDCAGGCNGIDCRHLWFGVSVEDQATANKRIPLLLQTPAAVRFVSYEPALGPVDFTPWLGCDLENSSHGVLMPGVSWLICGGESGPGARPMQVEWAQSAADQCSAAGVAFFMKQDSGYRSGQQGRLPDALWSRKEWPDAR